MIVGDVEDENLAPGTDQKLAKKFGQSPIFIASTQLADGETLKHGSLASLLTEAMHVISCGYEEKTEWGKEVKKLMLSNFHHYYIYIYIYIWNH